MCKAKNCKYYKMCAVKRECTDARCADYKPKEDKKEGKSKWKN